MLAADGGGHAGSTMSPAELEMQQERARSDGEAIVHAAVDALGIDGVETRVLEGRPGPALCSFATEVAADAIVMGTRGRGRLKRAASRHCDSIPSHGRALEPEWLGACARRCARVRSS